MYQPTAGGGCANLLNVSVTIQVTKPIAWASTGGPATGCGTPPPPLKQGFSIQLNCYSPIGKYCAWQQYIINLWGTQLLGAINTWPLTGGPIILQRIHVASGPKPVEHHDTRGLYSDHHPRQRFEWKRQQRHVGREWDVLFPKHSNSADGEQPAGDRCSADRRVHVGPGRAGVLRERSALVRRGNNCLFRLLPSYGDEFRARMRRVYLLHS